MPIGRTTKLELDSITTDGLKDAIEAELNGPLRTIAGDGNVRYIVARIRNAFGDRDRELAIPSSLKPYEARYINDRTEAAIGRIRQGRRDAGLARLEHDRQHDPDHDLIAADPGPER